MNFESLFTADLGLQSPWEVQDIQFDPKAGRIDFKIGLSPTLSLHARVVRNWIKEFMTPATELGVVSLALCL